MSLRVGVTETSQTEVFEAVCEAIRECRMEPVKLSLGPLRWNEPTCHVVLPLPPPGDRKEQVRLCHALDLMGIPYVGQDARAQHLALNKFATGQRLRFHGMDVPERWLLTDLSQVSIVPDDVFPVIVKPVWEGSSAGIWPDSVANDREDVKRLAGRIRYEFGNTASVIVEQFLPGREFSVGVIGQDPLPALEVVVAEIKDHGPFLSAKAKAESLAPNICPANLDPVLREELPYLASRAIRLIGCSGVARVDMRLDAQGRPHILEVNAMPGLHPERSDIPKMARAAGWSYADLIWRLVEETRVSYHDRKR